MKGADGKALSDAIENLPEILLRKKTVETHTNILGAVMAQIKARDVPVFFELEQTIVSAGRVPDKAVVQTLLRDGTKGLIADKARLLAFVAIATYSEGSVPSAGLKALHDEYDQAFTQGCQSMSIPPSQQDITKALGAISFLRRMLSLQNNALHRSFGSTSTTNATGLQSFLTTAQTKIKSAVDKAASFFAKFVMMYITKIVDNLSDGRIGPEEETFCYLDPKLRPGEAAPITINRYQDVIVFAIGGGCYAEYNNLQELLKQRQATAGHSASTTLRSITYGCSELVDGDDFLGQIEWLGNPSA